MKNLITVAFLVFGFAPVLFSQGEIAELQSESNTPWKVGAAKTIITPEKFVWMAGYGGRKAPADGKFIDLWAKALVLEDADGKRGVIVTLDLIGIDRGTSERICERLKKEHKITRKQIVICTSHTHSGPVVAKNLSGFHYYNVSGEQQKLIDEYADHLVGKIIDTVSDALSKMELSRLQWGSGKAMFAVNRRENYPETVVPGRRARGELAGPSDHDVPVLSVRDGEGNLRAVLFGYACHGTVIGLQKWSGDYPGYAQIELEKANPGCIALFWAGCGADQNPLPRFKVSYAEKYGAELAGAVTKVLNAPMPKLPATLVTKYREIDLALVDLPDKKSLLASAKDPNKYEVARAKILLDKLEKNGVIEGTYPYPIAAWKIGGEIDFIALGGEVVIDYALRLKRERTGLRTWVAGYSNDVMAYIPSARVLKEGGYEAGGKHSNAYYSLPGLWANTIETTIVKSVDQVIGE